MILPEDRLQVNSFTPQSLPATNDSAPQSRSGHWGVTLAQLQALAAQYDTELARLAELDDPDPTWSVVKRKLWERARRQRLAAERRAAIATAPRPVCANPTDLSRRKAAYLAASPGGVSGNNGHDTTIGVVGRFVRGFNQTPEEAYPYLARWNEEKCQPPWLDHELWHKIHDAHKADHRTDPGPRGWLLADRRDPAPSATPRVAVADDPSLAEFFEWISGPPLEPVVLKDGCGKSAAVSTFVFRGEVQEQRGHAPDPAAERRHRAALIVGRHPTYRPCPRAVCKLLEGVHPHTEGTDLVVKVRCKCWSCYVCRERRRWVEKRKHVLFALEHGTHVFRGNSDEWAALRKRLARAGQVAGTYRVVQDSGVVVILSAHTPDDLPEHSCLVRVDGEGAARALATAVDDVPDMLRPEPGKRKVKPFTANSHWLVAGDDEEDLDTPDDQPAAAAIGTGDGTDSEPTPAAPLSYYRAVRGHVVVSVDRADEILAEYGVRARRGHLIDAPLVGDGSVEDSLAWSAPIGEREAIRERLLGLSMECALPTTAEPGTLMFELIGATIEEPVPW